MANNAQFSGIQPLRPPVFVAGPPQNTHPSMPMQFRTEVPAQQSQPYMPVASQQYQPVVQINIGLPSHNQQHQFPQHMQQLPARPAQAGHNLLPSQAIPGADVHPNRPSAFVSPQSQQNPQIPNNYMPNLGGPRMPPSLSYSYSMPSSGQLQLNADAMTHYQPIPQMNPPPAPGQPWLSAGSQIPNSVTPVQQTGEQSSVSATTTAQPEPIEKAPSDWKEHVSRDGRRYYHNKKTGLSSWEKPLELMTLIERADASTDWKEVTSPAGRKYYYNRLTKQSKWTMPDELKLARARMASINESQVVKSADSHASVASSFSTVEVPSPDADTSSTPARGVVSSPIPVTPVVAAINPQPVVASESPVLSITQSTGTTTAIGEQISDQTVTPIASVGGSVEQTITSADTLPTSKSTFNNILDQDAVISNGVSAVDIEEAKKDTGIAGEANSSASGEKIMDKTPLVYESKLEAKNAFKALLESANIGSDWSWDQAMRVIINDKRYSALRSLGERKQAFNEFLGDKKKQDAEERRAKQKRAREDFKKMLEESKELKASTRWSKAIAIFEDDERFRAVERAKDREQFFNKFMEELEEKERVKALEEHKRNRMEYLKFLKSCDFITASSQWRRVQDRLEADETCSRLEKIDRLEIFQEYVHELEKEEEDQRKMRMEEFRKAERKNRDEFRKLMELHVAEGALTAETQWRDYCVKVKDFPAYLAVSSNTSGSTAKELFEDVAEELQKQYTEDKARIKDALKLRKISLSSTWTLEDFKAEILEEISPPPISDINLKLGFNELLERVREKEEKEAKKRKRAADDFYNLLCTLKEIHGSSKWEDHKLLFEDRLENWFIAEESYFREIFDKYITELKEKAKEKERKRWEEKAKKDKEGNDREKRKTKHRREKERGLESKTGKGRTMKDGTESDDLDRTETDILEGSRRSGKEKDKRHRKRHISSVEDLSFDEDEKDGCKSSRRHGSDHKKSKQTDRRGGTSEPDSESRHKRHRRDHRNSSNRSARHEELQDIELA